MRRITKYTKRVSQFSDFAPARQRGGLAPIFIKRGPFLMNNFAPARVATGLGRIFIYSKPYLVIETPYAGSGNTLNHTWQ